MSSASESKSTLTLNAQTGTSAAALNGVVRPVLPWTYRAPALVPVGTLTKPAAPASAAAGAASTSTSSAAAIPDDVPHVFRPLTLRGLTLKNRFVVSPMCMYSAKDGFMSDWHLMHLGKYAAAGASLVIAEMTSVQENGRISPFCSGLWKDEQIVPLKRITDFIHSQNSKAGIQIAHAGRKASTLPPFVTPNAGEPIYATAEHGGWEKDVVAPSAIAWADGWIKPRELTIPEIKQIVKDFAATAKRADEAGFDVVELHGAHGYLLNQFYSPISNTRTDEYGGSFENRIRFVLEVTEAVRAVWPKEKPLFIRLSCIEWVEGGWDMPQTVALAERLFALGVDLIDCSTGGNVSGAKIHPLASYQVQFSAGVKEGLKAKADAVVAAAAASGKEAKTESAAGATATSAVTGTVGMIVTPAQAEEIVSTNKADLVLIGRQFLRETEFVQRAAQELKVPVSWAPQYIYAAPAPK